jgi:DNA-nicking Smr family endonuclease
LIKKISDKDKKDWEIFLKSEKKKTNENFASQKNLIYKKINKTSDKDKTDWNNFIKSNEKIPNKDFIPRKKIRHEKIKKIDLHGYTIEEANKAIEQFIKDSFDQGVTKMIVITGKGLRSKNVENPYLSKDLSILKYSVPEYIETNQTLTKMILEITDAKIEDGGSGAFYVFLKNKFKIK